jgi:pimeloyl-ACP methyl ester carboxylesterase
MRILTVAIGFLAMAALAAPAMAQEIVGRWQGTLNNGREFRFVVVIERGPDGALTAQNYSIDQSPHPTALADVRFSDGVLTFKDGPFPYRGEVGADGQIRGQLQMGARQAPLTYVRAPATGAWPVPENPHTARTVTTDDGVKLEVLDFGGSGPPLLFVPGLGADGHVFDSFAPRFRAKHHVYAITRRGYGASDRPDPARASYSADRLSQDVLQVMTELRIEKPVLAGWSFGGEELSGVAARAPDRVAGLVYLDAAYAYALYTPGTTVPPAVNLFADLNDMRDRLRRVTGPGADPAAAASALDDLLDRGLRELRADMEAARAQFRAMPPGAPAPAAAPRAPSLQDRIARAITEGVEHAAPPARTPMLAIYALPGYLAPGAPEAAVAASREQDRAKEAAARAFETAYPQARVVRLANAAHAVFGSHPDDTFREMDSFLDRLAR